MTGYVCSRCGVRWYSATSLEHLYKRDCEACGGKLEAAAEKNCSKCGGEIQELYVVVAGKIHCAKCYINSKYHQEEAFECCSSS